MLATTTVTEMKSQSLLVDLHSGSFFQVLQLCRIISCKGKLHKIHSASQKKKIHSGVPEIAQTTKPISTSSER
jgi:hypothetical protein